MHGALSRSHYSAVISCGVVLAYYNSLHFHKTKKGGCLINGSSPFHFQRKMLPEMTKLSSRHPLRVESSQFVSKINLNNLVFQAMLPILGIFMPNREASLINL